MRPRQGTGSAVGSRQCSRACVHRPSACAVAAATPLPAAPIRRRSVAAGAPARSPAPPAGGGRRLAAAAAGKGANPATGGKGFATAKPGATKQPTKCACGSEKAYEGCCSRYHSGAEAAPTPEALLRARFSAYKLQLVDYLVATTHPGNPEHTGNDKSYARQVAKTAKANAFLSLEVGAHEARASEAEAVISFTVKTRPNAPGSQGKPPDVTRERSLFVREGGRWLYRDELD